MSTTVTLIPGDFDGPQIARQVVKIVEASGADIEWDWQVSGSEAIKKHGTPLPKELLDSVERNGIALKGWIDVPLGAPYESPVVTLRKTFDLYANLRPCRNLPGIPSRYDDVDIILVRENTQGEYSGVEHMVSEGIVEMMKVVTEEASRRIARFAFDYARDQGRKKITTAHKANILKLSDGLFLRMAEDVASEYPEIEHNTLIIDACCMNLVMNPWSFDMLLMGNLYGDIVSDLISGMVGGINAVYGVNIGEKIRVFESMHNKGTGRGEKKEINPVPLMMAALALLRELGENISAEKIYNALIAALKSASTHKGDERKSGISSFSDVVIDNLRD